MHLPTILKGACAEPRKQRPAGLPSPGNFDRKTAADVRAKGGSAEVAEPSNAFLCFPRGRTLLREMRSSYGALAADFPGAQPRSQKRSDERWEYWLSASHRDRATMFSGEHTGGSDGAG